MYTYTEDDPNTSENEAVCKVEGYVSEVLYRVYYGENTNGQYTIAHITIEFMLEKELSLDSVYCSPDNT